MSLHRYIVPPPLALAIHPAPPPKPSDNKEKNKEKGKGDKAKDEDDVHGRHDKEVKKDDDGRRGSGGVVGDVAKPDKVPEAPGTQGSMIPEPATPGRDGLPPTPQSPTPKNIPNKALNDSKKKGESSAADTPNSLPLEPIKLLGPAPPRPLRTRLDLNPSRPYPPINTDPRGAYHKYAKFMTNDWVLIDVTKDGWLTPQWKEKNERDALARLRGEDVLQAERETEEERLKRIIRKVPKTAEGVLLELWNDLVQTPMKEVSSNISPARY
jgi:hypothetical protein